MKNDTSSKPTKARFGAKPFAFVSGLLDILIAAAIIGLGTMMIIQMLDASHTSNSDLNKLIDILLVPVIVSAAALFAPSGFLFLSMGILTIVSSFKSDRKNFNGMLIAVMVFDALSLIPAVIFAIVQPGVFTIGLIVALGLGFNFKLADVILTKHRLKEYNAAKAEENKQSFEGADFSKLAAVNAPKGNEGSATAEPAQGEQSQPEQDNGSAVDFSKLGKK